MRYSARSYKTPNRRRLKKWRSRLERLVNRSPARGFRWFWRQTLLTEPLHKAAKRAGVNMTADLLAKYDALYPGPIDFERAMSFVLGYAPNVPASWDVPTRENLEI